MNKTEDGFIKENVVLARIGSMDYLGSELGSEYEPNKTYPVFVTEDELFNDSTISSCEGADVTYIHPDALEITLSDWKQLTCGHVQNIYRDGDYLKGTIFVKDANAIASIEKDGIKEVSLGYDSVIIEKDGKLIKTNIRANHLAIVPEGRCGSACKIGDSKKVKTTMAKKPVALKVGDSIAKMLGLKTSSQKAVGRKFGDAKKSIANAKIKFGDSVKKTLKDVEAGLGAEATEEEKSTALDAVATISENIDQAIELLTGADESVTEAEQAVEEIAVGDAQLPEGVTVPEELANYVSELEAEAETAKTDLEEANKKIEELEAELASLKGEAETSTAIADAKARFPKIKVGDAKSARDVQSQILVAKGIYTDAQVKTLTDCAIGSAYQALSVTAHKPTSDFGKKLIGDSKKPNAKTATQRLGGR